MLRSTMGPSLNAGMITLTVGQAVAWIYGHDAARLIHEDRATPQRSAAAEH